MSPLGIALIAVIVLLLLIFVGLAVLVRRDDGP
jgi:hypothetical protein